MKMSDVFIASILFFGLFTGGTQFMNDLWTNHDVQSNTSLTVREDYKELQGAVSSNNNSLRSKITTLGSDKGGILDAASAGLLLVPQFITVITKPITLLVSTLGSIHSAFSVFLPGWAATMIELVIISTIAYAIFSIATGVRS